MADERDEDPMLLEELEVVVGGLTRPWAGFWQPADLEKGLPGPTAPESTAPMPTPAGDH